MTAFNGREGSLTCTRVREIPLSRIHHPRLNLEKDHDFNTCGWEQMMGTGGVMVVGWKEIAKTSFRDSERLMVHEITTRNNRVTESVQCVRIPRFLFLV